MSKERNNEFLMVNKLGKNIRKSPLHQHAFNNTARQQPQPQIYNISKNDFRNIVQQLTGSPSHSQEPLPPRPPQNPPKPPSMRLQKIRPPPILSSLNRPHIHHPPPVMAPFPRPNAPLPPNAITRPQFVQQSPTQPPFMRGDPSPWGNTVESPVSVYVRYLQSSILDSTPRQPSPGQGQFQAQPPSSAPLISPNPNINPNSPMFYFPRSPAPMNAPGLLPSPTSQFLLPSPSGFMNLLSPGFQFPSPLTQNLGPFPYPSIGESGILGPPPQLPPSPGGFFALSPSGLFPSPNPMWRDH